MDTTISTVADNLNLNQGEITSAIETALSSIQNTSFDVNITSKSPWKDYWLSNSIWLSTPRALVALSLLATRAINPIIIAWVTIDVCDDVLCSFISYGRFSKSNTLSYTVCNYLTGNCTLSMTTEPGVIWDIAVHSPVTSSTPYNYYEIHFLAPKSMISLIDTCILRLL